jgi:hypothetical protein
MVPDIIPFRNGDPFAYGIDEVKAKHAAANGHIAYIDIFHITGKICLCSKNRILLVKTKITVKINPGIFKQPSPDFFGIFIWFQTHLI